MRSAGILMHITSLPSPWGVGTLGAAAREFVDFLRAAGQSWWQILPICPTGFGDSPYQSFSTYAGNPYLIDLDDLAENGLLRRREYQRLDWGSDPAAVDYDVLYKKKFAVLRLAAQRMDADAAYAEFCARNSFWLEDYALFMALKEAHGGAAWSQWEDGLKYRQESAIESARERFARDMEFWRAVQYLFFRQWHALRRYAAASGVCLMGDLPIYVAYDSADVWAHPEQFQLDRALRPTEVAGVPPDEFSPDGQLWGNPLFAWAHMEREGFVWWKARIAYHLDLYDALRIDHFRGFDSYYAVPYGNTDARQGEWKPGPGMKLFEALKGQIGHHAIVAEDLGYLTNSVRQMLRECGFPGMKILLFAFDSREGSDHLPHHYGKNCVAYTGTHDNDTALGWLESAPEDDVDFARAYMQLTEGEGFAWGMMRTDWGSVAEMAIVQMQDVLERGSEARMNAPGTVGDNWKWRALPGAFSPELAARLRQQAALYGRLPADAQEA